MKYIFILQCPIDKSIKHVGAGNLSNNLVLLQKNKKYVLWANKVKKKKQKFIIQVIDKVEEKEVEFYLEHYRWLFKSWGFDLLESDIFDKRDSYKLLLATILREKIVRYSGKLVREDYDVINYEVILCYMNNLLEVTGMNRVIDELMTLNIVLFIYGMDYRDFGNLLFGHLEQLERCFKRGYGTNYLHKFREFISTFIERYNVDSNLFEPVFQSHKLEITQINNTIRKSMKYFGYIKGFDIVSAPRISFELKQIYFSKHPKEAPKFVRGLAFNNYTKSLVVNRKKNLVIYPDAKLLEMYT